MCFCSALCWGRGKRFGKAKIAELDLWGGGWSQQHIVKLDISAQTMDSWDMALDARISSRADGGHEASNGNQEMRI